MENRFSVLRSLLSQPMTLAHERAIREHLEAWPDDEHKPLALAYAQEHIEDNKIRAIVAKGPSESQWIALCYAVDAIEDAVEQRKAIEIAEACLSEHGWPDQMRVLWGRQTFRPSWALVRNFRPKHTEIPLLSSLNQHPHITQLSLQGINQIQSLDLLRSLQHIEAVSLSRCAHLSQLHGLQKLPALRRLELFFCPELRDVGLLAELELWRLALGAGLGIRDRSVLGSLGSLGSLALHLPLPQELLLCASRLPHLTTLELSTTYPYNTPLPDLSPLQGCEALNSLELQGFFPGHGLAALAALPSLRSLTLDEGYSGELMGLKAELGLLTQLRELRLRGRGGHRFPNLDFLEPLQGLEKLEISGDVFIEDPSVLARLPRLRELRLFRDPGAHPADEAPPQPNAHPAPLGPLTTPQQIEAYLELLRQAAPSDGEALLCTGAEAVGK